MYISYILDECAEDWTSYDDYCYRYFPTGKTWKDARKHCLELEADLVSIHSDEETDFMLKLTRSDRVRLRFHCPLAYIIHTILKN